jgi:hypothetical protein
MKKLITFIVSVSFSFLLVAQEIEVKETTEKIANGTNPVLTVMVYEVDQTTVEKAWKNLMKDYDAKVTYKSEIFADNAKIDDISAYTVDVYAIAQKEDKKESGIKLIVAFDLGGAFLTSSTHPAAYKAAEKIMIKFAVDISKEAVKEKLEAAQKEQKELESDLLNLKKKNDKLHSEIKDYQDKIASDEKDIVTNLKDQDDAVKAIETKKEAVKAIQKKLDAIK